MKTLEQIKKEYPTLSTNGFGYYSYREGERVYISSGDITKRPKEFKAICDFLKENITHIKTITEEHNSNSYGWKHIVESNINHYISNGMLIAAALACGYKMKYKKEYGPNALFGMSEKDYNRFSKTISGGGPPLDDYDD
jgi:hypothetical protein|tara:strand:+ start:56 stop:472 length:417 start_codon:yes stop_codon:yes gene_type:complete